MMAMLRNPPSQQDDAAAVAAAITPAPAMQASRWTQLPEHTRGSNVHLLHVDGAPSNGSLYRSVTSEQQPRLETTRSKRYRGDKSSRKHKRTKALKVAASDPVEAATAAAAARCCRLRDRLQMREGHLQLDVNSLRQEIIDLQLHRCLLQTKKLCFERRAMHASTAVAVVKEYFAVFHNGFQLLNDEYLSLLRSMRSQGKEHEHSMHATKRRRDNTTLESQRVFAAKQREFISKKLDPNFLYNHKHTLEVFLEQWERYSSCHAGLRLHFVRVEEVAGGDQPKLLAAAKMSAYITRQTIEMIFPDLLVTDKALSHDLMGAFIEYPCQLEFELSADLRVVQIDQEVDFIGPLAKLMGSHNSLAQVATLMKGALIWDQCMIGERPPLFTITPLSEPVVIDP